MKRRRGVHKFVAQEGVGARAVAVGTQKAGVQSTRGNVAKKNIHTFFLVIGDGGFPTAPKIESIVVNT